MPSARASSRRRTRAGARERRGGRGSTAAAGARCRAPRTPEAAPRSAWRRLRRPTAHESHARVLVQRRVGLAREQVREESLEVGVRNSQARYNTAWRRTRRLSSSSARSSRCGTASAPTAAPARPWPRGALARADRAGAGRRAPRPRARRSGAASRGTSGAPPSVRRRALRAPRPRRGAQREQRRERRVAAARVGERRDPRPRLTVRSCLGHGLLRERPETRKARRSLQGSALVARPRAVAADGPME